MSHLLSFGADGVFGAKTGSAICASLGVFLTWASISNESFCHEGQEGKFVVVVVVVVIFVLVAVVVVYSEN